MLLTCGEILWPGGSFPLPRICIIVPVLNERDNILALLRRIDDTLEEDNYVVCIVDDGSTDGTRDILAEQQRQTPDRVHVIYREKRGRGSQRGSALLLSLLWGLNESDAQYFVEMDGDLSHRPEELPSALTRLTEDEADVVIACKYVAGSVVTNRPIERRMVSFFCNLAVRVLLAPRIHDYSNGYRFYTREAAEKVATARIRYGSPIYLSEVMAIWLRAGMRIIEVPTTYIGRNEGVSKLRVTDLIKAGVAVFEISVRRHLLGFGRAKRQRPIGS